MGASETKFVAQHKGQVGILTEIETGLYSLDNVDSETPYADEDAYILSDVGYAKIKANFSVALLKIQAEYPKTQIFFIEGVLTIDGRLSACAFTALKRVDDNPNKYESPYDSLTAINDIDRAVMSALCGANVTDDMRASDGDIASARQPLSPTA